MTAQGRWQVFLLDALPRLPAQAARWTVALARARLRVPSAVAIAAKGVRQLEIFPDRVSIASEATGSGDGDGMDWFSLECDGQCGWLGVDHRISLALVRAVLGGPAPDAIRPLGRGERGVMAAIVLSALDAIRVSQKVELGLGSGPPVPGADRLVVGGSVRIAGGLGGRAALVVPVAWLAESAGTGPITAHLDGLVASATLQLARTDLLGAALAAAAVGDAVVFDGTAQVQAAHPWPCCLRVGDFAAPVRLGADGTVIMVGSFTQAEEDAKPMASQNENTPGKPAQPSSPEVAEVLASAPVEVVAEIGRFTLRGDELAGLMKGGVLGLGPRRIDAIQLRVGGQPWAVGELVSVGDELGVRILKLHAG
ncbi:MAG: FliM/FliN family flagellar motor switch protein [Polyangia bacterium]